MRKHYDKLVRDKIPEIIENDGKIAKYEVVDKNECKELLVTKLQEELNEFLESREIIELADMVEVMEAYLRISDSSWDELMQVKENKKEKRGGFEKQFFLKWVDEK